MARARALHSFPREFWEIIEACGARRELFSTPIASQTVGLSFRGKFYGFVGQLRKERDRLRHSPEEQMTDSGARIMDLAQLSERVACYIVQENGQWFIRFMNRDDTPEAETARQILGARVATQERAPGLLERELAESARRIMERVQQPEPVADRAAGYGVKQK